MNVWTWAVIGGGVVVVAAGWMVLTRRSARPYPPEVAPEPIAEWRRPLNHRIAHAFRVSELRVERFDAEALALCGRWPVSALVSVAELVADDHAPRCSVCQRVWERLELRRP